MRILEYILLGLVQGASEFLPVSSSGHLLLLEKLGIGEENLFFNVCLHLGTLLSVLICMRKPLADLLRHPFSKTTGYIVLASVPTVALALAFKYLAPSLLGGAYLPLGFMLTAVLLFASEKLTTPKLAPINSKTALLTGVFQGIAVLPGVSRSGSTIAALRFCGTDRSTAAEFSFLLSVPVIAGSALYEGAECAVTGALQNVDWLALAAGVVAAFFAGCIAIRFFLSIVKNKSLLPFSVYTALLAVASFFVL